MQLDENIKILCKTMNQSEINTYFRSLINKFFQYDSDIFPVLKYVLESKEIPFNAQIDYDNNHAIVWSCNNDMLDLLDFLLCSPILKNNADINKNGPEIFIEIYTVCDYLNNFDRMKKAIFDYELKLSNEIIKIISEIKEENKELILNLFKMKEFNDKLKSELKITNNEIKIHKI